LSLSSFQSWKVLEASFFPVFSATPSGFFPNLLRDVAGPFSPDAFVSFFGDLPKLGLYLMTGKALFRFPQ